MDLPQFLNCLLVLCISLKSDNLGALVAFTFTTFLHSQSSIDNIVEFVKTMKTDMDTEDGYLEHSKLLVVSHDISLNSHTTWNES